MLRVERGSSEELRVLNGNREVFAAFFMNKNWLRIRGEFNSSNFPSIVATDSEIRFDGQDHHGRISGNCMPEASSLLSFFWDEDGELMFRFGSQI